VRDPASLTSGDYVEVELPGGTRRRGRLITAYRAKLTDKFVLAFESKDGRVDFHVEPNQAVRVRPRCRAKVRPRGASMGAVDPRCQAAAGASGYCKTHDPETGGRARVLAAAAEKARRSKAAEELGRSLALRIGAGTAEYRVGLRPGDSGHTGGVVLNAAEANRLARVLEQLRERRDICDKTASGGNAHFELSRILDIWGGE